MNILAALPEWFVQWGWMACAGAIFLIAIIITIIVLAVKRRKASSADEEQVEAASEEQPVPVAEKEEEEPAQTVVTEAQPVKEQPVKEQPAKEQPVKEQPVKEQPAKEQPEAKAEDKEEVKSQAQSSNKTYHVSKRKSDGRWQVKMAGGSRAIKLFFTQLEAIDFAKKLAENQEAKIVIHKEDGTFRRLTYHNKK